jgi:protein-disulfide isomerase
MRKTILGVIALVAFGSLVWYFGQKPNTEEQTASILEEVQETVEEKIPSVLENEFVLGNPDAPVTMIEYSSHLCGHCINFHQETLPLLIDKYVKNGQLKVVPRLLSPVELGMAVLCAKEQDKFRDMNEYLFENIRDIETPEDIKDLAGDIELDEEAFNDCLDASKYENEVVRWFESAEELNVEGTPTFFINGQELGGNQPASEFEKVIEEELAKM